MLKTRVITACILGALLLLGLFLLPPLWAVLAFGVVFTLGAWEWAGFGQLHGVISRGLYTLGIALLLLLAWRFTESPAQLMILLGAACVWWLIALGWLSLAPARHRPVLVLICGCAVLAPAFVAITRLQVSTHGIRARAAHRAVAGAHGVRRRYRRVLCGPRIRPAQARAAGESRQDLGGRRRRAVHGRADCPGTAPSTLVCRRSSSFHSAAPWEFFPSSAI